LCVTKNGLLSPLLRRLLFYRISPAASSGFKESGAEPSINLGYFVEYENHLIDSCESKTVRFLALFKRREKAQRSLNQEGLSGRCF